MVAVPVHSWEAYLDAHIHCLIATAAGGKEGGIDSAVSQSLGSLAHRP
jgi:hypothetical protein